MDLTQPITGTKAYPLIILEILKEHTDPLHAITLSSIAEDMDAYVGHPVSRNTVARNLALLKEEYNIQKAQGKRGVFLAPNEQDDEPDALTEAELIYIANVILTSNYVSARYASDLIAKLNRAAGEPLTNSWLRSADTLVAQWPHRDNKQFFLALENANEAICQHKKLHFTYNKSIRIKGDPVKESKKPCTVSPYAIINANGQFYLVAHDDAGEGLKHYRMDRITDPKCGGETAYSVRQLKGYENGLDAASYARTHLYMFGGEPENIKLKMPKTYAAYVIDAFGEGSSVKMEALDDTMMTVWLKTARAGAKYFALQYGEGCEVLRPASLREEIKTLLREMSARYAQKPPQG